MTRLPPRRKRPKSGIERGVQRVWPRHRYFLRGYGCVVDGCEREPVEVSHIRTAANAGTAVRPHDWNAVPMCGGIGPDSHHAEYHLRGHKSFEAKYRLDLLALAAAFAARSTDTAMKEAMRTLAQQAAE